MTLHLYTDDHGNYVVAQDRERAYQELLEHQGEEGDVVDDNPLRQIHDNEVVTLCFDDCDGESPFYDEISDTSRATAAEWAAHNGAGMLAWEI